MLMKIMRKYRYTIFAIFALIEKNGGDCYSKTEQTVTVLMAQN